MTRTSSTHTHNTRLIATSTLLAATFALYLMGAMPLFCAAALPLFALLLTANHQLATGQKSALTISLNFIFWITSLLTGFAIALYRPPDFDYPLIYHFADLDFSLYANLAKALAGYLIIVWLWRVTIPTAKPTPAGWAASLAIAGAGIAAVLTLAAWSFDVNWSPKWPAGIAWFALINLTITVMAEEAFFRLLLQDKLRSILPEIWGAWIAPFTACTVFALAHAPVTHPGFFLYWFAGAVYALVYIKTCRFSVAVATHFCVNLLHFLLLEYPLVFS